MDEFWQKSDVQVTDVDTKRTKRSTTEIQQTIRFNLFHIIQAAGRADTTGVPAKGLTGQAYEGQYFWDTEIYLLPFFIYTYPRIAKNLLMFRYRMLDKARERARELNQKGATFPLEDHQRGGSLGLLCGRNRSIPHQRRHHLRLEKIRECDR